MNLKKLNKSVEEFTKDLDGALLSCDIWDKESGLSVASYNPNEKYTALFGRIVNEMESSLSELGFPNFGEYQIIDLEMNSMLLIINGDGKYRWGSLIDKSQTSLGLLVNIFIPKARKSLIDATND